MRQAVAGAIAFGLAAGSALVGVPGQAGAASSSSGTLVNDEIVVASLDSRGLPIEAQLISRITSTGGQVRTIHDPTATANIAYLNRRGRPEVKGNGIQLEVGGPVPQTTLTQGLVDKPLPVAIHAEYQLNGDVVDPEIVVGSSGELVVTYTVTNTDIKEEKVTYQDAAGKAFTKKTPVFAPFVGTLTTTLPQSFEVRDTKGAIVTTDNEGNTVLSWSLLLYPPLGDYQQTVSFSAAVNPGAIPKTVLDVMPVTTEQDPAVGFTSDLFEKSVDGNEQMVSGLQQLDNSTAQLAQGAAQLSVGIGQLATGTSKVSTGFNSQLVPGSAGIASGAAQLASGQAQLTTALGKAATGADSITDGADQLAGGLTKLADGLKAYSGTAMPGLDTGAEQLSKGAAQLSAAVGSPDDPPLPTPSVTIPTPAPIPTPNGTPVFPTPTPTPVPSPARTPTLVQVVAATVQATRLLTDETVTLSNDLIDLNTALNQASRQSQKAAEQAAATQASLDPLYNEVCPPPGPLTQPQCDALLSAKTSAGHAATSTAQLTDSLTASVQAAAIDSIRAYAIALGSNELLQALTAIQAGVEQVAVALSSGSTKPGEEGLVEGLDQLSTGLGAATAAADQLSTGASGASSGAGQIAAANGKLAQGLGAATTGSQQLSSGSAQLASGASLVAFGTVAVGQALAQLAGGADQAANGTAQLADGANTLQKQGTAKVLEGVVSSSEQPALANAYLQASNKRAADALPYGLPTGATGNSAYLLTMDPVSESNNAGWALVALGILGVATLGGAVLKTLHSNRAA